MSGNYGWGGRDRADDFSRQSNGNTTSNKGFTRAHTPYHDSFQQSDLSRASRIANSGSPRMTKGIQSNVDLSPRKAQKTSRKNVLIISLDTTGSMGRWRDEIFQRLPLLYKEAQGFLGDDLEILFIGFGDTQMGDPFEVCPLGEGPKLDEYISVLTKQSSGGGNGVESSELPALYVHQLLDTTDAKAVYFFTITDEGFYPELRQSDVDGLLGLRLIDELKQSKNIFKTLKRRMSTFTIWAETDCYNSTINERNKLSWEEAVGGENVVMLNDSRRIVDVILGVVAKTSGQYKKFTTNLNTRQGGTVYGDENIDTVHKSLCNVPAPPDAPNQDKAKTRSLLDIV